MKYWMCPICGFEADSEIEKSEHLASSGLYNTHMDALTERGEEFVEDVKGAFWRAFNRIT